MQKLDLAVLPAFYEALKAIIRYREIPATIVWSGSIKRANGIELYLVRIVYDSIINVDKLLELAQKRALEVYGVFELESD